MNEGGKLGGQRASDGHRLFNSCHICCIYLLGCISFCPQGQKDGEKRNGGDWNEPLQVSASYILL